MAQHLVFLALMMATVYDFQTVSFSQQQRGMQLLEANLETLVNLEKQCTIDLVIKKVYCPHRNLTEVPDDIPMDVEILDLQSNRIHTLVNTSFTRYTNLIILNLSGNNICYIEPATFATLTHLQDLDLSYNKGIQLRNPGGLPWSWNLTRITLANCNIKHLPIDFMEWFPKLRDVSFLNNDISNVNLTCSPFTAERITKMSFCGNQIHELIPETFRLDCDIDYLDLLRNRIIRISPHVISLLRVKSLSFGWFRLTSRSWINLFTGIAQSGIRQLSMLNTPLDITLDLFNPLHNYPLFKLHLSHIYLQRINHSAFSNLTQLEQLTVEYNDISVIEPEYFYGMKKLKFLQLSNNFMKTINPFNTTWRNDIQELLLDHNDLMEIHENTFSGLHYLSVLDLASNKNLRYLKVTSATGLHNLQVLNVTKTNLNTLLLNAPLLRTIVICRSVAMIAKILQPGETFAHSRSLEEIFLNKSNVYLNRILDKEHNISLFDGLNKLKIISLRQNLIVSILPGMFWKLRALEILDLATCGITEIDSDAFRGLTSLHTLILDNNEIQQLPHDLLFTLKGLQSYNLKGNKIYYLDDAIFANTTNLTEFVMSENQFAALNQSTFMPLYQTLTSLDISQNQLDCNCKIAWLLDWLQSSSNLKLVAESKTICSMASLENLGGKPLLTFDPKHYCGPDIGLLCSLPLALVGVFAMMFAIHRYRWLFSYKLFLLKLAVVGYQEVVDARNHGDFEYDLNIMFLEDDEHWVQEHLRPVLEERLPNFNRIVFGDEDLVIGMHYFDAVFHAVEKSFKTVLLFSRAAFQDNWFMIKFRVAFEQVNDARMENVVVIFIEDIPDAELPYLVRLYLSERRTYLWWVEDERHQEYFWNELILTLQSDNMRWNNMIPLE
nr:toll-like receptor 3 [Lytechinus pictus]